MNSNEKVELVKGLIERAIEEMRLEAEREIEAFLALSPQEQMSAQLKAWQVLLDRSKTQA